MIYDADAHLCYRGLFDDLKSSYPEFVEFFNETCVSKNLDRVWHKFYNNIKDPSWPDCALRSDFANLPLPIRTEIKEQFLTGNGQWIKITDDLSQVIVDNVRHHCPTLGDHVNALKLLKVDCQLLTMFAPYMLMYYQTDKKLAVDVMREWNKKIHQLTKDRPEFECVGWLALQDLDSSIVELQTIVNDNFFAVQINDDLKWSFIPDLWSIFETFEENNLPVYLHPPNRNPYPQPWKCVQDNNYDLLKEEWPEPKHYWLVNIAGIISQGVLEKFPNLRIIVAEHGINWVPRLREFMISNGMADPLLYFQKNFWFTVEPEEPNFLDNANLVGWDRLLFATDYPHNDFGGDNRMSDVDIVNNFLLQKKITQQQYNLLTHENFLWLKNNR